MLLFLDSCGDHYATGDIPLKYQASSNWQVGTTGRNGNCVQSQIGFTSQLTRNLTANAGTLICGFAFRADTLPTSTRNVFSFGDGGTAQVTLMLTSAGALTLTANGTQIAASANAVIGAGTWAYVEVKSTFSATATGSAVLRVNGSQVASVTNVRTTSDSNAYANQVSWYGGYSGYYSIDDVYLCDSSGTQNNDFNGDCKVLVLQPSGAGKDTGWTKVGTPTTNYACVNDTTPDGDTSYVGSGVAGTTDTYAMTSLPGTVAQVLGVQTFLDARKDDSATRQIAPVIGDGTTDVTGSTVTLGSSYAYTLQCYDKDPVSSSTWTPAIVNARQVGATVIA